MSICRDCLGRLPLLPWFILGALCAQGALITSAPAGGSTTTFAGGSTCSGGPDAGFTIIVVTSPVCWNVSTSFGFTNNGFWNNPTTGFALIGANSNTAAFTIDLGGLYAAACGFMNYNAPAASPGPTISAIAADGVTVLESYDLSVSAPISTPGGSNAGAFRGISRPSADIRYVELANSYVAIHDITLASTTSAVPEPSSFGLLGLALSAALARIRRTSGGRSHRVSTFQKLKCNECDGLRKERNDALEEYLKILAERNAARKRQDHDLVEAFEAIENEWLEKCLNARRAIFDHEVTHALDKVGAACKANSAEGIVPVELLSQLPAPTAPRQETATVVALFNLPTQQHQAFKSNKPLR